MVAKYIENIEEEYKGDNVVFIVGCPRSGTTWLQQLLASHPKARTGTESFLFSWFIGPQLRRWHKRMNQNVSVPLGLGGYFRQEEFIRNLKRYLHVLMRPMVGNLQRGEFFIEKTPNHALYIEEIMELLPNCKVVHILRDARDTVASLLAASKAKTLHWWHSDSAKECAKLWVETVKAVKTASEKVPSGQLYELKYRDLKASTEVELTKLCKFLSLDWDKESMLDAIHRNHPAMAAKSATGIPVGGEYQATFGQSIAHEHGFIRKGKVGSWKEELSWKEKLDVWLTARHTMNEVGYSWKYPW